MKQQTQKCSCCSPLTHYQTKKTFFICPSCESLLEENSGYNPEDATAKDVVDWSQTQCTSIKEFITKFPKVVGRIYRGKIYFDT